MWYRCQKDAISRRKQDDSVLWRTFKQTEALKKKGESMRWYKMPNLWKNDVEERCIRFQLNHLRLSPLVTCFPLWLWTEFSPLSWCQHASINLLSFNTNIKKGIYPNPQGKKIRITYRSYYDFIKEKYCLQNPIVLGSYYLKVKISAYSIS